jgi:hypothetical protein
LGRYWINKSVADVLIARPVRKLRAGFGFQVGDVAGTVFVVTREAMPGRRRSSRGREPFGRTLSASSSSTRTALEREKISGWARRHSSTPAKMGPTNSSRTVPLC